MRNQSRSLPSSNVRDESSLWSETRLKKRGDVTVWDWTRWTQGWNVKEAGHLPDREENRWVTLWSHSDRKRMRISIIAQGFRDYRQRWLVNTTRSKKRKRLAATTGTQHGRPKKNWFTATGPGVANMSRTDLNIVVRISGWRSKRNEPITVRPSPPQGAAIRIRQEVITNVDYWH